jgi:hypothetical protein
MRERRASGLANPFPDIQIRHFHSPYQAFRDCKYSAVLKNRSWADWKIEFLRI